MAINRCSFEDRELPKGKKIRFKYRDINIDKDKLIDDEVNLYNRFMITIIDKVANDYNVYNLIASGTHPGKDYEVLADLKNSNTVFIGFTKYPTPELAVMNIKSVYENKLFYLIKDNVIHFTEMIDKIEIKYINGLLHILPKALLNKPEYELYKVLYEELLKDTDE